MIEEQFGEQWADLVGKELRPPKKQPALRRGKTPRSRRQNLQETSMPSIAHYGAAAAAAGSAAQGRHLGGMINQTMGAIRDENDSRVSQAREARRLAQEREMEQMRINAMLEKLRQEREMAEKKMRYDMLMQRIADDKARGVRSSSHWTKEAKNIFGD